MKRISDSKCFLGTIILSILVMLGFWNYESAAKLFSGTLAHNHSSSLSGGSTITPAVLTSGTGTFSGVVSSTKSCASTYERKTINYCQRDASSQVSNALTRDACSAIGMPAGAVGLVLEIVANAKSNNAIASRLSNVHIHDSSGCTASIASTGITIQEFSATAIGTTIGSTTEQLIIFHAAPFIQFLDDTGNQGTASYTIIGYFD